MVLAGGQGTRLRPLTYSVPKQLIPIGGRPVLSHVLHDIASCGISEAIVITSPQSRGPVSELLSSIDHGLRTTVVVQDSPDGLAAAFGLALPYLGGASSLLYLGDCLVTGGVSHLVEEHSASGADATILVKEVADPQRYGIVEMGEGGRITSLVEKPQNPPSNQAIVGVYAFGPAIARSIESIEPSHRGEYEITDAIQHMVSIGGTARGSSLRGWWVDIGTIADVVPAHVRLMDGVVDRREGTMTGSEAVGEVVVEPGAHVKDSRIEGPAIIESGAVVENSQVGPGSHIGRTTTLERASIRESILMEGARIKSAHLLRSVVGPQATIIGNGDQSVLEVVVGSDASVTVSANQDG